MELTSFAARAKDLGAWRDAVVDAAGVGTGLWLSYLFVLFYFAIAAGAVTHRDLLLENPVKLPFLNVELPLKAFFILGPLVFLIVHAYVLLHFVLSAGKIGAFDAELRAQVLGDEARARLRRQLPSNVFVQSLAGPRDVRKGPIGFLLRRVIEISLVAGPIALLVLFQLQFLPYHSEWITSWQRLAVALDLILLWVLWPPISRGNAERLRWGDFKRVKTLAWLLASILPVLLVVTIATFPGEWLEENLPPVRVIPTAWPPWKPEPAAVSENPKLVRKSWASLHELLVAGEVNYVTGRPQSLWSNRLVLPFFAIGDRVKFDAEGKIAISSDSVSLRGRSLEGAVFVGAHLRKGDFVGARLAGANFIFADLRETKFNCSRDDEITYFGGIAAYPVQAKCTQSRGAVLVQAQLQGADLGGAQLQGALLDRAELQGANLDNAQLQNAVLVLARLQGANLGNAQLQAALLFDAQLQAAFLGGAQLQGAFLRGAQLQGAGLDEAQLQGASLTNVRLDGTSLRGTFVWRTNPPSNTSGAFVVAPEPGPKYLGLDCRLDYPKSCEWSEKSYAALKSLIEGSVPSGVSRVLAMLQIAELEKPPDVKDEDSAKGWAALAELSSRSSDSYPERLAKMLSQIGCVADGAPSVIRGLIPRLEHARHPSQAATVARAFLNDGCLGAHGLSEDDKAKLQEIRDRGRPALPGPSPGAAVQ